MNAPARIARVTRLFARGDAPATPERSVVNARELAQRKLYEDVGDFLFAHALTLNDVNFAVALAHLRGDRGVTPQVDALLREHPRLTDAMLAAIKDEADGPIRPEMLADVAEKLAATLAQCLHLVDQSSSSVADYGAKLDLEVASFQSDPMGALDRLIRMTRDVVGATRAMEERLDATHRETDRLRSNLQRARREADRDHLTGLPNRRNLEARLAALAPDDRQPRTVALIDIDDFKLINDNHGHEAGDRVLRFIARLLRAQLGDHATVARFGGEEFALLFEDTGPHAALTLIDAARAALGARTLVNQDTGAPIGLLSFSGGIAAIQGDARAALRAADTALYEAKRSGKNRIALASMRSAA